MKGSILDIPIIVVFLFAGILAIFISYLVLSNVAAAWPAGNEGYNLLNAGVTSFTVLDQMYVMYALGLGMFVIMSAFFIKSHPIFFIFSAILLSVTTLMSAMTVNAFDKLATTSTFIPVSNAFPLSVTLFRNLPLFCLVIGVIAAILMYGKGSNQI